MADAANIALKTAQPAILRDILIKYAPWRIRYGTSETSPSSNGVF
jgi:hypothetical protein